MQSVIKLSSTNGNSGSKAVSREWPLSTQCGHLSKALLSVPASSPASRLPQIQRKPWGLVILLWEPRLPAMGREAAPKSRGLLWADSGRSQLTAFELKRIRIIIGAVYGAKNIHRYSRCPAPCQYGTEPQGTTISSGYGSPARRLGRTPSTLPSRVCTTVFPPSIGDPLRRSWACASRGRLNSNCP